MTTREYNEKIRKELKESTSVVNNYSEEEFSQRTKDNWEDFDGLCRKPTQEEVNAWKIRCKK